jgi:hypothetical protein
LALDRLAVGPGLPVLAVYGEGAYRAALATPGLCRFSKVGLPDGDDDAAPLLAKLRSRAVVLWPSADEHGRELALKDAATLVDLGANAVGIVDTGFPFEDAASADIPAIAHAALRDAVALALPIHHAGPAKQTRAVVPALAPVDGAALFARLAEFLNRHLAEPPTTVDALALWCLAAWMHDAFDVSPRLILHANDPRAGHARALRLIAWLTPSPLVVSRTIAAHVLPVIAADRPTLLLDDVGGTMLTYLDMRALIAAGALKDGAFLGARTRRNPTGWSPCFAPTAIATMSRLPDDVRLRAIVIPQSPPSMPPLALGGPPAEVARLRAGMQRWAKTARTALPAFEAVAPERLPAAHAENWYPLLAVGHAIGTGEGEAAARAAQALSAHAPPAASNLELLRDIREVVGPLDADARVPSLDLLKKLTADPERAWGSAHRGRKLTPRALADRLERFNVRPRLLRLPDGTVLRGYQGEELADAFARFLQ